jgi:hypothetical protein
MVECVQTHLKYDTSIIIAYHATAERKGKGCRCEKAVDELRLESTKP